MTRPTHNLTFSVDFAKGDDVKTLTFGIHIDPTEHDSPKEAAIIHVAFNVHGREPMIEGYLPRFRTYRTINLQPLSDVRLS